MGVKCRRYGFFADFMHPLYSKKVRRQRKSKGDRGRVC